MKREKKISSLIWGGGGGGGGGREGESNSRERKSNFFLDFLMFGPFGSRQVKKQSCSMLQGLRVGTDFDEFRQIWEVGIFSYLI